MNVFKWFNINTYEPRFLVSKKIKLSNRNKSDEYGESSSTGICFLEKCCFTGSAVWDGASPRSKIHFRVVVFWGVAKGSDVAGHQLQKCWSSPTSLHDVTTHKATTWIFIVVKTPNLVKYVCPAKGLVFLNEFATVCVPKTCSWRVVSTYLCLSLYLPTLLRIN